MVTTGVPLVRKRRQECLNENLHVVHPFLVPQLFIVFLALVVFLGTRRETYAT